MNIFADGADGIDHMARRDGGAGHLRQHRLEDHVIVIGHKGDALAGILSQLPGQGLCAVNAGETSAGDDDIEMEIGWIRHGKNCSKTKDRPMSRSSSDPKGAIDQSP